MGLQTLMKKVCCLLLLLGIGFVSTSQAWWVTGRILCDANQNGQIDSQDIGVPSVLAVVTNTSGTYSNWNWSHADGVFIVQLREAPDTYVLRLHPATLPRDSTFVFPIPPLYQFSISATNEDFVGADWLINNPDCQLESGGCWLTGGGTIGKPGRPDFSFGGNVFPGCSSTAGDGGEWNVIAHNLRLQFKGTVIQSVRCGNVQGIPPGSTSPITPFNFIEFTGTGALKGTSGNKVNYANVSFYARAEDRAEPGSRGQKKAAAVDRFYLRVYSADNITRLLISGDPSNPTNIVTVPLSTGNLQLHVSSCDNNQ